MRNAISGLILLACICFVAFACVLVLTCVAVAGDCGGCDPDPCQNCKPTKCETKCSPCKPRTDRDPCRAVKPKCISTEAFTRIPGKTKIPVPKEDCRLLPDCCEMGIYELIKLCPERYTICAESGEFTMLCDVECKPCKPVKCDKCEFDWCSDECKTPKCAGGDDCNRCGKTPGCHKCKP